MYPGPHLAGGMGAAQRSRIVATGKRHPIADTHSQPDAYTNSKTNAHSDTYSSANPDSNSYPQRRQLFCTVGRHSGLHCGKYCKPEWHQLYGQFLDAESKSGNQQWRTRQWTALDLQRSLPWRPWADANADTESKSDTETESHSYA